MDKAHLIAQAFNAQSKSYSPYSNYQVGAAIETSNGNIYCGCNVENASYGASICAERSAALQAVYNGDNVFTAVAIAGGRKGSEGDFSYPCGICRQFLWEFAAPDMIVIIAKSPSDFLEFNLSDLIPHTFGKENVL